ncbi:pyroglutamyl-peptidase I [Endozoicomonas elysicola]|uniref:Pyrrolidone-carboxylate peptidase n=1 Tax=Endozoicomonas elysicola TaxID=305900 RepID=A0A081KG23_9GAMM|nr:pyroglutamyl-peptidase I [Endozoicomonas elysicola]KEI73099.1 pyrrolidone-carboxylate peptidase [Endozoicomonas elysicola]
MKTVLISGFEPFGGMPLNPALEAIRVLTGTELPDLGVIKTVTVPVVHRTSIATVISAIDDNEPDAVIMVGLAPGRIGIMPERIAINMDDFRLVDNEGNQIIDQPVVDGGPAAYFSTLPVKAMVQEMRRAGIPAAVSNSAGTFVCNHLFYGVMHELRDSHIRAGFIHVPLLPGQAIKADEPSMSLERIIKGISICAETVLSVQKDIFVSGGEIA